MKLDLLALVFNSEYCSLLGWLRFIWLKLKSKKGGQKDWGSSFFFYYYHYHDHSSLLIWLWLWLWLLSSLGACFTAGTCTALPEILVPSSSHNKLPYYCPIRSVIILVSKQIGLPLRGRPSLLITRMITDRIGLHSVLLPLLIIIIIIIII